MSHRARIYLVQASALVIALGVVLWSCAGDDGDNADTRSAAETEHVGGEPVPPDPDVEASETIPEDINVYAYTLGPDNLSEAVADVPTRVYVPNNDSATVDVIDPTSFEIIDTFSVGTLPQHVVPSWDLSTLYVNNNIGNTLTPIDPVTGRPGDSFPIQDPYNLYFTPDGTKAIVVAERDMRLDFYDPNTWEPMGNLSIPHEGVNHADFTADGSTALFSCEFSGWVVRVDLETMTVTGELEVGGEPIDVKLSPDGSRFYVANHTRAGVSIIDPDTMTEIGFTETGQGAHGLYPSRDASKLYVSNRLDGTVSVLDFNTGALLEHWAIGGSPDMGGVSTDGTQLWLSGRYDNEVYVIDTATGELIRTIPTTGSGPHGLALFPQPGRYSMGHTGNFR
jgi:YVTN family beta-propeller protein